jgi:hypothetical protein
MKVSASWRPDTVVNTTGWNDAWSPPRLGPPIAPASEVTPGSAAANRAGVRLVVQGYRLVSRGRRHGPG